MHTQDCTLLYGCSAAGWLLQQGPCREKRLSEPETTMVVPQCPYFLKLPELVGTALNSHGGLGKEPGARQPQARGSALGHVVDWADSATMFTFCCFNFMCALESEGSYCSGAESPL